MNYRNIASSELNDFLKEFPELTVGQVILAVLSQKEDSEQSLREWLFNVSDEDLYTAIEKAKANERD